jgi:hypothetical protein
MGCGGSKEQANHQANTDRKLEKKQIRAAVKAHGGPRDAVCHICGRKYTIHSIDIHVPQCEKLWIQRQELLPKKDRKPVPKLQGNPEKMTLAERNEMALKLHQDEALETCQYCGRTFLPDRLKVHVKSCERSSNKKKKNTKYPKSKPPAPPKTNKKNNYRESRDALKACKHCGRKFYFDRLEVHLRTCAKPAAAGPSSSSPSSS